MRPGRRALHFVHRGAVKCSDTERRAALAVGFCKRAALCDGSSLTHRPAPRHPRQRLLTLAPAHPRATSGPEDHDCRQHHSIQTFPVLHPLPFLCAPLFDAAGRPLRRRATGEGFPAAARTQRVPAGPQACLSSPAHSSEGGARTRRRPWPPRALPKMTSPHAARAVMLASCDATK